MILNFTKEFYLNKNKETKNSILSPSITSDIEKFLVVSTNKINEIYDYIENNKIEGVSKLMDDNQQYFKYQNKYYIIKEEKHANDIYQIISNLNNWASFLYNIENQQNIVDVLKEKLLKETFIPKEVRETTNFLIKTSSDKKLVEICCNYISTFIKSLFTIKPREANKKNELFLKSTFDISIGHRLVQMFLKEKIFSYCKKKNSNEIYKAFDEILNSHINLNLNSKYFDDILQLSDSNIKSQEIIILKVLLIKYLVKNNLFTENNNKDINKAFIEHIFYKKETVTYLYQLGSILCDALIKHEILEITAEEDLIGFKNVVRYQLKEAIRTLIYSSATFSKPYIITNQYIQENIFSHDNADIMFLLKENTHEIKESYHTKIVPNPKLEELITFAGEMPYKVYLKAFNDLLDYLNQWNNLYDDTNDEDKYHIILLLYKVDIKVLLKNNCDKKLINEVIKVALKINETFDIRKLQKISKNNLAIYDAFNKINNEKMNLKGLLNDLNIFQYFNYFYLSKHATSSGRLFTSSFFISLQANKTVHAFIINKKNANVIDYNELKKITEDQFKKDLPATIEEFEAKNKILYLEYIKDKLLPNTNIKDFPLKENYNIQIEFLIANSKKKDEILTIRSMILAYLTNTWKEMFYGKDATSSGTQIISLINRMPNLTKLCNVSGSSQTDIYRLFVNPLTTEFTQIKNHIHYIFNNILQISLENALSYESIFNIKPKKSITKKVNRVKKELDILLNKKDLLNIKNEKLNFDLLSTKELLFEILNATDNNQLLQLIDHFINFKHYKRYPFFNLLNIPYLNSCWNKILITKDSEKDLKSILLNLNKHFLVYKAFHFLPEEVFLNRKLFKRPVMTLPYSAGAPANIENFIEYFKEDAIEKGFSSINPLLLTLTPIILNDFFTYYCKILLKDMNIFLNLCRKFIDNVCHNTSDIKPIKIKFPFLSWIFIIYKRSSHQTPKDNKKFLRTRIYIEENCYYKDKMKVKFPSIFIQGIDAQIVYNFLDKISMYHKNLIPISVWTNHDCFHINAEYAMLLDIILQNIYCSLSTNTTYIKNLYPNDKDFETFLANNPEIVCTNPFFIKF